jgi:hypothetical protein
MAKIGMTIKLLQDIKGDYPVKQGTKGTIVNVDYDDEFKPYQISFETGQRLWIDYNIKMERVRGE